MVAGSRSDPAGDGRIGMQMRVNDYLNIQIDAVATTSSDRGVRFAHSLRVLTRSSCRTPQPAPQIASAFAFISVCTNAFRKVRSRSGPAT